MTDQFAGIPTESVPPICDGCAGGPFRAVIELKRLVILPYFFCYQANRTHLLLTNTVSVAVSSLQLTAYFRS